jgi:hypothetical protein
MVVKDRKDAHAVVKIDGRAALINRIRRGLRAIGVEVGPAWPPDFTESDRQIISRVQPYSMTTRARLRSVINAVEYIVGANIEGAIVECGVWKGGSMMAAALTLLRLGAQRPLVLYDTFGGMTAPTSEDVDITGAAAHDILKLPRDAAGKDPRAYAAIDEVRVNLLSTGYDGERMRFVRGPVEETLPHVLPDSISCLRLDTDWYQSTKHELEHLYPRLTPGGVLILDDYGYWRGSRQAVDEYFTEHGITMLLSRIDTAGRIGVKRVLPS